MQMTERMKSAIASATSQVDKAETKAEDTGGVWGVVSHILVAGAQLILALVEDEYDEPTPD